MQIAEKIVLLISHIPDLRVYTIKTPLIGRISIRTGFSWSQKLFYLRTSCIYVYSSNIQPKSGGKTSGKKNG